MTNLIERQELWRKRFVSWCAGRKLQDIRRHLANHGVVLGEPRICDIQKGKGSPITVDLAQALDPIVDIPWTVAFPPTAKTRYHAKAEDK